MRPRDLIVALSLAAAVVLAGGCGGKKQAAEPPAEEAEATEVECESNHDCGADEHCARGECKRGPPPRSNNMNPQKYKQEVERRQQRGVDRIDQSLD